MGQENQTKTKRCPFCAEEIQFDAIKCKHCGEWLNRKPADEPQPYNEYPKNWDEIRKYVYKRDNYTCKGCGATDVKLYAHHIIPLSSGGSNTAKNLITLCEKCHTRIHPHIDESDAESRFITYEEFEKELREAILINPEDAPAHYNLGLLLHKLEKYEESEKEYQEAIRINPRDADAHNNLGILLKYLGRYREAETEYQEAIRINPEYRRPMCYIKNFREI